MDSENNPELIFPPTFMIYPVSMVLKILKIYQSKDAEPRDSLTSSKPNVLNWYIFGLL